MKYDKNLTEIINADQLKPEHYQNGNEGTVPIGLVTLDPQGVSYQFSYHQIETGESGIFDYKLFPKVPRTLVLICQGVSAKAFAQAHLEFQNKGNLNAVKDYLTR